MPFASKATATNSNGTLKKGFKEITDKNGKTRYLSTTPATRKASTMPKIKDSKKSKESKKEPKKSKESKKEPKKAPKVPEETETAPDEDLRF